VGVSLADTDTAAGHDYDFVLEPHNVSLPLS